MVVLAVVAAIAAVTSVIAVAIVALPRENRYAIGEQQPGNSGSASAAVTPSALSTQAAASASSAAPAPTPQQFDLPGPVLAAVSPRVVPNNVAVTNKIRAIKVNGATGSYSGSVVGVGTGELLYADTPTP